MRVGTLVVPVDASGVYGRSLYEEDDALQAATAAWEYHAESLGVTRLPGPFHLVATAPAVGADVLGLFLTAPVRW